MSSNLFTQSNIVFATGIISGLFAFFKLVIFPQKRSESNDLLLDQQAKFRKEEYDKRFADIQIKFENLTKDNQNHLHTIEDNVKTLTSIIVQMGKDIVKLETIINERIPKQVL